MFSSVVVYKLFRKHGTARDSTVKYDHQNELVTKGCCILKMIRNLHVFFEMAKKVVGLF